MRVPSRIGMGRGVRMRKRSSGGVMLCRLAASEKKAKTSSRGSGRLMRVLRMWSVPLIIIRLFVARVGKKLKLLGIRAFFSIYDGLGMPNPQWGNEHDTVFFTFPTSEDPLTN